MTQTFPLALADATSALEAAGPDDVAFDGGFFAGALAEVVGSLGATADFAEAEAGALVAAGEALGVDVAAGTIVLSLSDFLLPLFLVDVLAGALAAAGALEDPVLAGEDPVLAGEELSAAPDFLLFFLLLVDGAEVSLDPAAVVGSNDFLLLPVEVEDVEDASAAPEEAVLSALAVFLLLEFLDFVPAALLSAEVVD